MGTKTAVCLYGFLRTCENARHSFFKHVVVPNGADVFVFAPDQLGAQYLKFDKMDNGDTFVGDHVGDEQLVNWFGPALKGHRLWTYDEEMFSAQAARHDIPIVAGYSPIRIFSMFYHMKNAIKCMEDYEERRGERYETVILTRPDIAFYTDIAADDLDTDLVQIPYSTGKFDGGGSHSWKRYDCVPLPERVAGRVHPGG